VNETPRARRVRDALCAGTVVIGLGAAHPAGVAATTPAPHIDATRATTARSTTTTTSMRSIHSDDRLLQLLARIRGAEIAANESDLAACAADAAEIPADARAFATERIALARNAVARRTAARSGAELARAEDELAAARLELLRMGAVGRDAETQRALALELRLEAAEDLLLRRLAADSSDAALALGVASASERTAVESMLARARSMLPAEALQAVLAAKPDAIATDPATFRAAMLGGVLALAESDLERDAAADLAPGDAMAPKIANRAEERRAEAARLLEIASRTELPLPRAIADLLTLARARVARRGGSERERLLAEAVRAADPAVALVAAIEQTPPGARSPDIVARTEGALAVIAACAVARRDAVAVLSGERLASGASASDAMLASLLERTASDASKSGDEGETLAAVAAACALRFDAPMRRLAEQPSTTPLYAALSVLRADADGVRVELVEDGARNLRALTDQAARDPKIATWFAIPYASALVRLDPANAARASELLLALAERSTPSERTRAALAIALDERRARAARSPEDEARLVEALAVATRAFARDPARNGWILESVDLAMFPRFGERDLARAGQLLASVARDDEAHALRTIELAEIREPSARDLAELRERATTLERALASESGALRARNGAVRAALAQRAGDATEASALAARAIDADPASQAAERAVATWATSLVADRSDRAPTDSGVHGTSFAVPERLGDVVARSGATRAALLAAAEALADRIDRMCDAGVATSSDAATRERLRGDGARLAALASPLVGAADGPRAESLRALGLLLANDATARSAARAAVTARPDDRGAAWVLGEALLRSDDAKERAEGFAVLRDLAPIGDAARDRFWWRAQAAMLETLAAEIARGDARRAADLAARANRLESIDPALGGLEIKRRIDAARSSARSAQGAAGNAGSTPKGRSDGGTSTNAR